MALLSPRRGKGGVGGAHCRGRRLRGGAAGLEDGTKMIPRVGILQSQTPSCSSLQGGEIPAQALKGRIQGFGAIPVLVLWDYACRLQ